MGDDQEMYCVKSQSACLARQAHAYVADQGRELVPVLCGMRIQKSSEETSPEDPHPLPRSRCAVIRVTSSFIASEVGQDAIH
jgi:hypothetical protein